MSEPPRVVVTARVEVDPARAFALFTEDVDAWWKQGPAYRVHAERPSRMRFEPGVGGRFLEQYDTSGADVFEHGRVRVWDPPRRLVFELTGRDFRPGEVTQVEVRFEPEGAATRVTVEHHGWEHFPAEHPVRHGLDAGTFAEWMRGWWDELLAELSRGAAQRQAATR